MQARGIHTAYTIARATSFGMNIVLAKMHYAYGGTLYNNTQIGGQLESMNVWPKKLSLYNPFQVNTNFSYVVWWNLLLIAIGSYCIAVGTKSLAVPQQFIPGGIFGLASLCYYSGVSLSLGWLYALFNVPLFLFAWFKVKKRFFWYSAFAVIATTIFYEVTNVKIALESQIYGKACLWRDLGLWGRGGTTLIGFQWRAGCGCRIFVPAL